MSKELSSQGKIGVGVFLVIGSVVGPLVRQFTSPVQLAANQAGEVGGAHVQGGNMGFWIGSAVGAGLGSILSVKGLQAKNAGASTGGVC
ncbi:MAG: hypothetical protein N2C14_16455 [Planctomycetales bacterium]